MDSNPSNERVTLFKQYRQNQELSKLDKQAMYNYDYFVSYASTEFKRRLDTAIQIAQWIVERYSKNIKILDVGCGIGHYLIALDKLGVKQLYGVDISPEAIFAANKKVEARLAVVDIDREKLPYRDNFFDVVWFAHVIEHLQNPVHILHEIRRTMKKKGALLLATENAEPISVWLRGYRGSPEHTPQYDHYRLYTIEEIAKMLESTGFVIKSKEIQVHDDPIQVLLDSPWANTQLKNFVTMLSQEIGLASCFFIIAEKS
ncbi:MAG: class I SAM-dependent methyltransferase [bacterium]